MDTFQIKLKSNSTTGYSWAWVNRDKCSLLDIFGFKYILDEPIKVGSGGLEIWNFKATYP
jgi:predicted secreted protein